MISALQIIMTNEKIFRLILIGRFLNLPESGALQTGDNSGLSVLCTKNPIGQLEMTDRMSITTFST